MDTPFLRSLQQHAWFGFAASAPIPVVMRADENFIHRKRVVYVGMHLFQLAPRHQPPGNIRLISDDETPEAKTTESLERHVNTISQFEFLQRTRGEGFSISDDCPIDHPVPIQKYGGLIFH